MQLDALTALLRTMPSLYFRQEKTTSVYLWLGRRALFSTTIFCEELFICMSECDVNMLETLQMWYVEYRLLGSSNRWCGVGWDPVEQESRQTLLHNNCNKAAAAGKATSNIGHNKNLEAGLILQPAKNKPEWFEHFKARLWSSWERGHLEATDGSADSLCRQSCKQERDQMNRNSIFNKQKGPEVSTIIGLLKTRLWSNYIEYDVEWSWINHPNKRFRYWILSLGDVGGRGGRGGGRHY